MTEEEPRIPQPPPGRRASPEGLPSGMIVALAVAVGIFVAGLHWCVW